MTTEPTHVSLDGIVKPQLTAIRLEVYGKLSFRCRMATIASARTIGGVHEMDRYWGDRVADSSRSPV